MITPVADANVYMAGASTWRGRDVNAQSGYIVAQAFRDHERRPPA